MVYLRSLFTLSIKQRLTGKKNKTINYEKKYIIQINHYKFYDDF